MNAQVTSFSDPRGAYEVRGGEIVIGGLKASEIVARHGSPLYVYDLKAVEARRAAVRAALPPRIRVTYAVKANPNPALVGLMGRIYDGIDIASGGEMAAALEAGVEAGKMSFAGPGKSLEELRFAIGKGVGTLSIESEREFDHVEAIAASLPAAPRPRVMIRVNPDFELARSGLKMGGGPKQFGVDSERVPALWERIAASAFAEPAGIHIFSGTQNLSPESILEAFGKILAYACDFQRRMGAVLPVLNLGGGFGIPYFKGDAALDLAKVGAGIASLIAAHEGELGGTVLKIELGRFLVGESGTYLAAVRYRKVSRGETFLILDGGMHHHLAASGNISQSPIRRQMRVLAATRVDAPVEKVNLAGPLCTPLDTFGMGLELPRLEEGDLIAIPNSGAYGVTMSPARFLGHPPPGEICL